MNRRPTGDSHSAYYRTDLRSESGSTELFATVPARYHTVQAPESDLRIARVAQAPTTKSSSDQGIQVVRFHVWQDLTLSTEEGTAPLHASVTLEMTSQWYLSLSVPDATIKIEGLDEDGTVEGRLVLYRAHYGLGLSHPDSRQLQFMMSPALQHIKLVTTRSVSGTVGMRFRERHVTLELPEMKVIFTR